MTDEEDFVPLSRDELLAIIEREMIASPRFADSLFQTLDTTYNIIEPYESGERGPRPITRPGPTA